LTAAIKHPSAQPLPFCTTNKYKTIAGKGKSKRSRSVKGDAQSNQLKKKCSSKATNGLNNIDAASSNTTGGVAVDPTVNNNTTNEMNAVNKVASSNATRVVAIIPTVINDATNGMNAIDNAASSNATRGVVVNSTVDNDTGGGATSSNNAETNQIQMMDATNISKRDNATIDIATSPIAKSATNTLVDYNDDNSVTAASNKNDNNVAAVVQVASQMVSILCTIIRQKITLNLNYFIFNKYSHTHLIILSPCTTLMLVSS
jgi:hypothetical protein